MIKFKLGDRWKSLIILGLMTSLLCIVIPPVTATNPKINSPQLQTEQYNPGDWLQEGKTLYDAGRFAEAIKVLQQAVDNYRSQGNKLRQAVGLSNLALAYQKLGLWQEADKTVRESLQLLEGVKLNPVVLAQILDIQGSIQLELGQAEQALATWQRAEGIYKQVNDQSGVVSDRINQAQAWQVLGFYRRSLKILTELRSTLQAQPNSLTKAVELRSLGDTLQLVGDLEQSRQVLAQSLEIAKGLQSSAEMSATLFSLGNTARTQQNIPAALDYYQQAAKLASTPITKIQAAINQLSLLVETRQVSVIETLLPQIQTQLVNLPPSQSAIYARIHLAQNLMKLGSGTEKTQQSKLFNDTAQLLATAVQQSRNLDDKRAEAYALGTLGSLYEQTQQWSNAQEVTQKALVLTQTINAPDINYRWYWQLGRLLKKQGDIKGAITAYDTAISELRSLRSDLVAVNRDVQYSFKESVEPVYRQSVELLLQSSPNLKNLEIARQRIESLQLAELDDFFRQACINARTVVLDEMVDKDNPTSAIIYPIILPQQLQVIIKIPQQPLHRYVVNQSQQEVESTLTELREALLEPEKEEEVQTLAKKVYDWLIPAEIETNLAKINVNTLVFVLDGALRNIPMAALYDGQKYLVEKYAVALSLGLQLIAPKSLTQAPLNVLAAGLVQPPKAFQKFPPLPEIQSELNLIAQAGISTRQLLNNDFTSNALEKNVNTKTFNVLHLATHGQFSSRPEDTFILANDGPINVLQFDNLLRRQDATPSQSLEMLVLSACETATGDNRATLGLAGASVKAGARSTLASLWHINDKSTAILIGEFYRELVKNKVTKAEALRHAQIKLLRDYPNYSRPGYWAPYILVGNWL
ncbi:CHAT domain-containing protein [Calothrix sp. PCC 7507]|uniref:CHAT domain-containing protein n=1 Tax=Calothrix sp. PCC 7507 TaxID=99598 RepID=UPI00029F45B6|nr:CHAT domain-containing protein [Calothrix sp. PCC 7507]AFY34500.1 Tetratricopeptide TPR_1 repeat-containing protein [Calothrix sp. PCC 7507]